MRPTYWHCNSSVASKSSNLIFRILFFLLFLSYTYKQAMFLSLCLYTHMHDSSDELALWASLFLSFFIFWGFEENMRKILSICNHVGTKTILEAQFKLKIINKYLFFFKSQKDQSKIIERKPKQTNIYQFDVSVDMVHKHTVSHAVYMWSFFKLWFLESLSQKGWFFCPITMDLQLLKLK